MSAAPSKKPFITVNNLPKGISLEDFFAGLKQQQTKRGKKHSYAPIDPTIHRAEYEKPIFELRDIDNLANMVPDFPAEKVEIQRCNKKQKLSRASMKRRQAFLELLNQAVWRYISGKNQTFIAPTKLLCKAKRIKSLIEELQKLLHPAEQDEAGIFVVGRLERMGIPLVQTRLGIGVVKSCCENFESVVLQLIQNRETAAKQRLNKSNNKGDAWFSGLINDLCVIWVVIFERDVGTSSGEHGRSGPLLRFVQTVLQKAGIAKSDDTIVKAIRTWKYKYGES